MSFNQRACIAFAMVSALASQAQAVNTAPKKTLTAFANEAQLQAFFKRYADQRRARELAERVRDAERRKMAEGVAPVLSAKMAPIAMEVNAPASPAPESVTNTQTAGVDEGGIVKVHGDHLVMLRRGRLFTVNIGQNQLKPISAVNAYGTDADPAGTWYDEMLIAGDTVAVIGYSYSRGGTELGLFDIDRAGKLSYRATYHMRSNDYYSANNYASRQVGSKLIFYAPLNLNLSQDNFQAQLPALRKWRADATPQDFKRIAPATRIYRTDDPLDENAGVALHTVTVCDLAKRDLRCEATAVMGPTGRVFYASGESVYVWTTAGNNPRNGGRSGLFRIPLDGSAPSALKVAGAPLDQFSFLESGDGHLNVLVSAEGNGEGMWKVYQGHGQLALLRVPLHAFSDGRESAPAQSYQALPGAEGDGVQNRYVGQYLLYGTNQAGDDGNGRPQRSLFALRWADIGQAQKLSLPHEVERIEAMGDDAVVIGAAGRDLHFTSIKLGQQAAVAHRYIRRNASQGESRSHGFFYKPGAAGEGMIGLPIVRGEQQGRLKGFGPSASVIYLRNDMLSLNELGALKAGRIKQDNDGCVASCVDWYGNARPLFLKGRVFALMGYELVEGQLENARLAEVRRISYLPHTLARQQ